MALSSNSDKRFADQHEIVRVRRAVFHGPEERASISSSASAYIFLSQRKILFRVGISVQNSVFVTTRTSVFHSLPLVFPEGET